jgi:hypothetical protein
LSASFPSDLAAPAAGLETIGPSFAASLKAAARAETPYRHWMLQAVFGEPVAERLARLPFPVPDLGGVSGARELHNNTRQYFDRENNDRYAVCGAVADVFQSAETAGLIAEVTGADIEGCFLRIEYAQDSDGFWLKPHTDLGVKKLTMLYYLAGDPGQETLGTDIYRDGETWSKRAAFAPDTALVFVPSDNTWHGFEPRPIRGVRKSVIINYVTNEWRAREQLAYPDTPVRL